MAPHGVDAHPGGDLGVALEQMEPALLLQPGGVPEVGQVVAQEGVLPRRPPPEAELPPLEVEPGLREEPGRPEVIPVQVAEDDRLHVLGFELEGGEEVAVPAIALELGVPGAALPLQEARVHQERLPTALGLGAPPGRAAAHGLEQPEEIGQAGLAPGVGQVEQERGVALPPALAERVDAVGGGPAHAPSGGGAGKIP